MNEKKNSDVCFSDNDISGNSINDTEPRNVIIFVDGTTTEFNQKGNNNPVKGHCLTMEELQRLYKADITDNLNSWNEQYSDYRNNNVVEWRPPGKERDRLGARIEDRLLLKLPFTQQWMDISIINALIDRWNTILITGKKEILIGSHFGVSTIHRKETVYSGKPIKRDTFLYKTKQDMKTEVVKGEPEGNDRSDFVIGTVLKLDDTKQANEEDVQVKRYLDSLPASTTDILVDNRNIRTLPNLNKFTRLQRLYCNNNKLIALPNLPKTLQELYCDYNELTALPTLPPGLTTLSCSHNQITVIPQLPPTLKILECNDNKIAILPPKTRGIVIYEVFNQEPNF